jgi:hypothetical protein
MRWSLAILALAACGAPAPHPQPIGNTSTTPPAPALGPETALPGDATRVVFERSTTPLTTWLHDCDDAVGKLTGSYVAMTASEKVVVGIGTQDPAVFVACAETWLLEGDSYKRRDGDHMVTYAGSKPGVPPFRISWGTGWFAMTLFVDERTLPAATPPQLAAWKALGEFQLGAWSKDPVIGKLAGVAGAEVTVHATKFELTKTEWERSITGTATLVLPRPEDAATAATHLAAYTVGPIKDPGISAVLTKLPYKVAGTKVTAELTGVTFPLNTLLDDLFVYSH